MNGRLKLLIWAMSAMVTVQTAVTGWTVTQIIGVNERISKIEANRFTAEDGLDVYKELLQVRTLLAQIK